MDICSLITSSKILNSIAVFFGLIGTLLIIYADKHKVRTIPQTPGDIIPSFLNKNVVLDPIIMAKRKYFDPHNLKMRRIKIFGISLIVIASLITVWAIIYS